MFKGTFYSGITVCRYSLPLGSEKTDITTGLKPVGWKGSGGGTREQLRPRPQLDPPHPVMLMRPLSCISFSVAPRDKSAETKAGMCEPNEAAAKGIRMVAPAVALHLVFCRGGMGGKTDNSYCA